jgi:hypothetical protein
MTGSQELLTGAIVSNPACGHAERPVTGENARVSTRTLLVLAAITGFLILAAFAVQIFLSR